MRRAAGSTLLLLASALCLCGQATPNRPLFEVASVKVNTTDMVSDRVPRRSGDNIRMHNARLGMFVIYAYGVENAVYQLDDKTGLLGDTMFDIDAIAPGAVSEDDLRLMFQT